MAGNVFTAEVGGKEDEAGRDRKSLTKDAPRSGPQDPNSRIYRKSQKQRMSQLTIFIPG